VDSVKREINARATIDSHRHAWDCTLVSYPWLNERTDLPRHTQPSADDAVDLVLIEAGADPRSEAQEFSLMLSVARRHLGRVRIVSAVPQGEDLPAMIRDRARDHDQFVGIRITMPSADTEEALDATVRAVIESSMTLDVLPTGAGLGPIARLAERLEPHSMVIDHSGLPPLREGIAGPAAVRWLRALDDVAGRSSAAIKLSGFAPMADPRRPLLDQSAPFLRAIAERVPPERLMVGSDWPVSAVHPDLERPSDWANLVATVLGSAVVDIMSRTAQRFYRF